MKILSILFSVLLLTSCSTITSFKVAPFNGSEYEKISHLRTSIALIEGQCHDPVAMKAASVDINNQAFELVIYSQGLPGNTDAVQMETNLHLITSELMKRYASVNSISETYCEDKLQILLRTSTTIQKSLGAKQ